MSLKKIKIGILGGSFDPAHKGHLVISKEASKRLGLEKIIWAITKKNPFKKQSVVNVSTRIKYCKKIIGNNNFIKVKFYEKIIKSNKTINLINYISKNKKIEIYFLMGADTKPFPPLPLNTFPPLPSDRSHHPQTVPSPAPKSSLHSDY